MTKEDIQALFPIKAEVTQEILDTSNVGSIHQCNGAKTLQSVLKLEEPWYVHWGDRQGYIANKENYNLFIEVTTDEDISFMSITEPTTVTFKLAEI